MVVAWTGNGASDNSGIYQQRFNTSGNNDTVEVGDTFSIYPDQPSGSAHQATLTATNHGAEPVASLAAAPTSILVQATAGTSHLSLDFTGGQTVSPWSHAAGATPSGAILPTLSSPSEADLARFLPVALPSSISPAPVASLIHSGDTTGQGLGDADRESGADLLDQLPPALRSDTGIVPADTTAAVVPATSNGAVAWQQTTAAYFATEADLNSASTAGATLSPETGEALAMDMAKNLGPEAAAVLGVLLGGYPVLLRREWDT
jgi:hypothetical protein